MNNEWQKLVAAAAAGAVTNNGNGAGNGAGNGDGNGDGNGAGRGAAASTHNNAPPGGNSVQQYCFDVNEHDVLCGRGAGPNENEGNIEFRNLVLSRKAEYLAAPKLDKVRIASNIVDTIRSRGGRFLKKLSAAALNEAGFKRGMTVYELADEPTVLEKAKHTLRQNRAEFPGTKNDGGGSAGEGSNCGTASTQNSVPPLSPRPQPNFALDKMNHSNNDFLSRWCDADYWRKLCPYLTISENVAFDDGNWNENDDSGQVISCSGKFKEENILERIIGDGYALINSAICSDKLREKLGHGISDLEVKHSLPATFALLFDETWELAAESHHLLLRNNTRNQNIQKGILRANNMAFNFDVLAWYIDPRLNQAGFSPHRDRQPDSLSALEQSFYADGQAKYITHWIALEDANPENSCLYVIPKEFDPGYLKGDDPPEPDEEDHVSKKSDQNDNKSLGNEQFSDPLSRALDTKQSYQNIRALPRQAGQSVIFTHRILHWGSRGNKYALDVHPRVAISFVYSDIDFEAPYLSDESFSEDNNGKWNCPPFTIRLLLVCAQLLIYYQRFNLSASTLRACYDYCKSYSDKLHPAYRKKVFVEFVKAMKERRDGKADVNPEEFETKNGNENDKNGDDANSEDEEALLEEMLNHSEEFDDDYDGMCNKSGDQSSNPKKRKHN
ncbi:hypothetical protein ACHAXR_008966 [Thalassiosira sp. AJA248-18]